MLKRIIRALFGKSPVLLFIIVFFITSNSNAYAAINLTVNANTTIGTITPYYQGYYDLSPVLFNYSQDSNLYPLVRGVNASNWRVSVGRWEIGSYPNATESAEREYFTGTTLADAQDPSKYNWTYMDKLFNEVSAAGMQPFISIDYMPTSIAKNTQEIYNWPTATFSNNIHNGPALDNQIFAEVVVGIIKHYNQGWANGYTRNYQYWELWNEPDVDAGLDPNVAGIFWNGTKQEFFDMYSVVSQRIEQEFGASIKFGGASFASPIHWLPEFLDFVKNNNLPLDFLSYHMYNEDPMQFDPIMAFVKDSLNQRGMNNVETVVGEWGRILAEGETYNPWYDNMGQALHHSLSFILMNNNNIKIAHHSIIRDVVPSGGNMGVLFNPAAAKPTYYAYQAYDWLNQTNTRLQTVSADPIIIAGKNSLNSKVNIIFFNPTFVTNTFSIAINSMPWTSRTNYVFKRYLLNDTTFAAGENLKLVETSNKRGNSLNISKNLPLFSLSLISLESQ